MANVTSNQPWAQRQLNQSGIRRLKIVDAKAILLMRFREELIPKQDFIFYEFIFPSDMGCVFTTSRQTKDTGSVFWNVAINFSLPHFSNEMVNFVVDYGNTHWIAIAEDYNGQTRCLGGSPEGLQLNFSGTTGAGPKDSNPMSFTLSAEQILPYMCLLSYDDEKLFPSFAGFSYGFSTGFNS